MDRGVKRDRAGAASYFLERARAAIEAADHARSDDAQAAHCKEAETWLYMASHCLNPDRAERPQALPPPLRRAAGERRSFQED